MPNHFPEIFLRLMNNNIFLRLDWLSLLLYIAMVCFGIINIYSTTYTEGISGFETLSNSVTKQFWIFVFCLSTFPLLLFTKPSFFENFSYIFYGLSILSLIGLFIFGHTISGANSWYLIGGFSIQPSEFSKITTAMVLALNLSSFQNDIRQKKTFFKILFLIVLPMLLIIFQPDPGSALVFIGLFFVLIREGLDLRFLYFGITFFILFIFTLLLGSLAVCLITSFIVFLVFYIQKGVASKTKKTPFLVSLGICIIFSYSVNFIFNSIFEQRHRDRFNIILGLDADKKGIGYNINQSKIAIGSGGLSGKGFLNGTQTKGNFVPEQHTDYIFSTIGEEWGFIGSSLLIIGFTVLILRIIYRAEKQTSAYRRIFSYAFASILFVHFFINIGMTLGLVPTVGIPLPFISYGGSNLIAFSIMLFIYLNFDANRLN